MDYEAIIVGAGPAGIFSALTLAEQGIRPVLLLELGKDLSERKRRNSNDMLCGWGGAGAYSDGKLTLSPEVGGLLGEYLEPDSSVKVRILGIDQRRHRVALSMQGIPDANLVQENVETIEG